MRFSLWKASGCKECSKQRAGAYCMSAGMALALLACVSGAAVRANAWEGDSLERYHNKNRLIFVFAPDPTDKHYARQQEEWNGKASEFRERDMIRFDVFGKDAGRRGEERLSTAESGVLRRRFGVGKNQFRVVLVGKDGHTALSSGSPVSSRRLFGLIDAMPMRRDEMRLRRNAEK